MLPVTHCAQDPGSWMGASVKNDNRGLGNLSEGGVEACNKLLRRFKISLSRKCDHVTN